MKTILLVLATALLAAASSARTASPEKVRFFPVCRHLSFHGDDGSHCMPATVLLKRNNMDTGQRFIVLGDRPSDPGTLAYYDVSMDVLLYYSVGKKLPEKTRTGEDQWRLQYSAAVFWCVTPALGSKLNPGETPAPPAVCGSTHGDWKREFQGRGTGGLPPDSVAQQILRDVMPAVTRSIPPQPPKGPWQGYTLTRTTNGKTPGRTCRDLVLVDEAKRDHVRKVILAELRGIPVPAVGEGSAELTICDGNDIVVASALPATEIRCAVEPPYDLSDIDTIAGNCARKAGEALRSGRVRL